MSDLFRSLRGQLSAAIISVLALGLGMLLLMAGTQMSRMTLESFTHEQQVTALMLTGSFSETLEQSQVDKIMGLWATHSDQWRRELPADTNLSIFDTSGMLLASSTGDSAALSVGVPALLAGDIVSHRDGERLTTAVPVRHEEGEVIGILQIDSSLAPLDAQLWERWLALIGVTAATLLLTLVITLWLAAQITQPLAELRGVAEQMAEGRMDARVEIDDSASELAELGAMFNHMAGRVEANIQQQRDFVANASHELRAPLAAMKLRAEILATRGIDAEQTRQYAVEIDEEVSQLAGLVGDLLQLSRAESGGPPPPERPVSVADELAACVRSARPRSTARGQQIAVELGECLAEAAISPSDLAIMVGNLLDNAIKYSPEGGQIRLAADRREGRLEIAVSDNGPGIPAEDLPRVQERFFRVNRAHTRDIPGSGLGLALVAAVARQYGGTLLISSSGVPGEGTCARLSIPARADELWANAAPIEIRL
ncbi:HAMP domain-containing protein [Chloroflexales bacterium ZM16-3]|nr:HAMP domain-containing protein [Chloroflexales bacterium ZM16-3]